MANQKLATVTNELIESYGNTAKNVINAYRVGNERAELPKSCMWLCCGEVKDLATNLRVCACGITRCLCIDEWTGSTR